MIELLVLGVLFVVATIVIGVLGTLAAVLGWLVFLPFRLLGFVFRGLGILLGLVIGLPVVLVGGTLALLLGGVGLAIAVGVIVLPLLPFLALGALAWWLLKPRRPRSPEPSGATVVG